VVFARVQRAAFFLLVGVLLLMGCSKEEPTSADIQPPTVTILSPQSNISVSGVVNIEVEAEDNEGVVKVEFYIDETLHFTDQEPPWEDSWQTITYENETKHSIMARAYDRAGNSGYSEETNVVVYNEINNPPTVIIYQPVDSSSYIGGEQISFYGEGWDALGNALTGDQLSWFSSLDGALGTGTDLVKDDLSADWHVITLVATDDQGLTGKDSTVIHISSEPEMFQVTYDGSLEESPCWSPDGGYIAYASYRAGNEDVWKISFPGGSPIALTTHSAHDWGPAWSSDGQWIAFTSARSGNADIWKIPDSGGDPVQVTTHSGWDTGVSWSPAGENIVISSMMSGGAMLHMHLWILPMVVGDSIQLTTEPGYEPDWFEDYIAFRGDDNNLYITSPDGMPPLQVTDSPALDDWPCWSPDGDAIAFTSGRSGNWDIWVWSRWDSQVRQLTFHSGRDYDPAWSPDGQWIAFTSDRSGNADIWVIRAPQ
jgi:hypothetical protein